MINPTAGEPGPDQSQEQLDAQIGGEFARELYGDLPCRRCRYNLRGLSIRSNCPECGLPVRATLLAVVDPHAKELQPIDSPRATAVGLLLWALGGCVAALAVWTQRLGDLSSVFDVSGWEPQRLQALLPAIVLAGALMSGAGAVAFIRPHARIPRSYSIAATFAVVCYLPLIWALWQLHGVLDLLEPTPFFGRPASAPSLDRSLLRLVTDVMLAAIALLIRPNGRLLVARSMLLRSGRVDRQTLLALAASAAVAGIGDLIHLVAFRLPSGADELARLCGSLVIGLGSLLLTIGMVNLLIDSLRILPVVVAAPLSLEDAMGQAPAAPNGDSQP